MSKINEGMAEAEVLAILGRPDDVSTQKDWQRRVPDTLAVWHYGTAGHMKAATLGQICIGNDHRVRILLAARACLRPRACLRSPNCGGSSRPSTSCLDSMAGNTTLDQ